MNELNLIPALNPDTVKSLPGHCYTDTAIFDRERQSLFRHLPVMAATSRQIEHVGSYAVTDIASESVIVARDKHSRLHAFANTCRHRGTRLVENEPQGKRIKCFTCPYHAWRYDLDGRLLSARGTELTAELGKLQLRKLVVQESSGLIFYHANPGRYPQIDELQAVLGSQNLARATIGARQTYTVNANWKLWVENFLECWHCAPNHPELRSVKSFIGQFEQGNIDNYLVDDSHWRAQAKQQGWTPPVDLDFETTRHLFRFNVAIPLARGKISATKSGAGIGSALGSNGLAGGAIFGALGPFLFYMAYVDHVVLFSVRPHATTRTNIDVTWLVAPDFCAPAEELTWLWHKTIQQDIHLVEQTQRGVSSLHYTPGQFQADEYRTQAFTAWWNNWKQDNELSDR